MFPQGGVLLTAPKLYKVLDPRDPLAKMRRRQVYAFAKRFKIPFTPGEPAEDVRHRIKAAGFTGTEVDEIEPAPLAVENPEQPADYTVMKMPELRRLCKQRGIAQSNRDKRPDLIGKLNGDTS